MGDWREKIFRPGFRNNFPARLCPSLVQIRLMSSCVTDRIQRTSSAKDTDMDVKESKAPEDAKKSGKPLAEPQSSEIPKEYKIGERVLGRCGSSFRLCEILSKRELKSSKREVGDGDPVSHVEYYVHFIDCNRRLDRWINGDDVLPATDKPLDEKKKEIQAGDKCGQRRSRRGKRKLEEAETDGHASIADPTLAKLEKDHEEITKVKNVDVVYMAGYHMDAWYYSPYPEEQARDKKLYICEFCLKYFRKVGINRKSPSTLYPLHYQPTTVENGTVEYPLSILLSFTLLYVLSLECREKCFEIGMLWLESSGVFRLEC
eukprot:1381598-Amorphochlora_amoeboformis.AAC.2